MTCVLSMTPLYLFGEDVSDIHHNEHNSFDFHWITSQKSNSGLPDSHRCSSPCRIEACTGSSVSSRVDVSNGLPGSIKQYQFNVNTDVGCETKLTTAKGITVKVIDSDKRLPATGKQRVNSLFEMSNKTDVEIAQISTTNHGLKRKVEETYLDEVYIPSKRVSPFLNTPKERKDKRRKIINISTKKLKQLDDPETFLRRTVLVNNTMKRLQMELREEKLRTKEFKSNKQYYFSGYGVLNDKVMSNSYFVDDPFLSCVHEKITDDMTDTLMNNVFHDKVDDRPTSYDICEKSDIMSNKMETLEAESDHVSNNLLDRSEDSLEQCTCDRNGNIKESRKECYPSACSENRPNMKEMLVDRCVDLDEVNRISTNSFTENSNHICCDKCLSVIIPKSSNASNENTRILPREVQEMQCDQNVENDIKASPANFVELRT